MNCHCISTAFQGFHTKEDFRVSALWECQKLHNSKSAVKTLRRKNQKKSGTRVKLRRFTSYLFIFRPSSWIQYIVRNVNKSNLTKTQGGEMNKKFVKRANFLNNCQSTFWGFTETLKRGLLYFLFKSWETWVMRAFFRDFQKKVLPLVFLSFGLLWW